MANRKYSFKDDTDLTLSYCYEELQRLVPNITKQYFSDLLGGSRQNIGQRINRNSKLTANELETLKEKLQELGIPSRFLDFATLPLESQLTQVPVRSEVELSCGTGTNANADFITDTIGFDSSYIRRLGGNPKTVSIVYARGDSMESVISSGDSLMVDESKKYINDGNIYAFVYDSELYCKKIQKTPNELVAISFNEDYKPFKIEKDRPFEVVGQVISVIKKL